MKRRWTLEEKLVILREAESGNVVEVCRKHNVSTGAFYNWKKKFDTKGEAGLRVTYDNSSPEMKKAEEEIRILRKLLADREIELEVQKELLKKVWDRRSKKNLVDRFLKEYIVRIKDLLGYVGLSESSYYYKEKPNGRKGILPSKQTNHISDGLVNETTVIESIKEILDHEFIDCGYRIMTKYLQRKGFDINHKKVYRIMSNTGLLKPNSRIKRSGGGRKFVKFRKVYTSHPMECLEMDIKMIWIPNMGKNAYLLSVIDVHIRKILGYTFAFNVKQKEVIKLLSTIIDRYPTPESLIIRSDNGSQFIARNVRDYIHLVGFEQEFTHVATPEENAHIEAYHGTLKRDTFDRVDYCTFGEIEQIIKRYVPFYNNERLHGLLGRIAPIEKWQQDQHLIKKQKKAA